MERKFKSGFVTVVGRPNAGKSTLVNRLVGQKVSIVTPRPQTTRNRIQGIVNRPDAQVVLIDTPGLHRPDSALGRQMAGEIDAALEAVDLLALIVDASESWGYECQRAVELAKRFPGPRILLLNKIDRVDKASLLPMMQAVGNMADFAEIIPISALSGEGSDVALQKFIELLPEGDPHFPVDQYTDQPERFLAAEIVREKAMSQTSDEVPHALAVLVDAFDENERRILIRATIYVERDGQKGILIGRAGESLKKIGTAARKEMEQIFGANIFLELFVKVQRDWRDNPRLVRELDWRRQLEHLAGE